MQVEKVILHTDDQGDLIEKPKLPANAIIEAIFLVEDQDKAVLKHGHPPSSIAGKGKILGDIVSPVIPHEEWNALK